MYAASYGYGNAAGQPFNGAPPAQSQQMQHGPGGPSQPHQQQQQQQQVMYNQQYPMSGPGGGAYHGAPNPGAMMPGGAGPAGMMQNTAMPHMAANGQMGYQTPYTTSPYGPNIPSTSAPPGSFNPNYMMANNMSGYPMNPAGMNPQQQHMMQRMSQQAAHQNQAGVGAPNQQQRQFPGPQGTPNPGQQQFGAPQNPQSMPPNQTPTPAPHSANSVTTPQTPTFPQMGQGLAVNGGSAPASPGTLAKDQERLAMLLDINTELLYEALHLKHSLEEIRKDIVNPATGATLDRLKELKEEENAFSSDCNQVFRRLQANLQYLATLTSNKVSGAPAPTYLQAPPLNLKLKFRPLAPAPGMEPVDGGADREERNKILKDLYEKLQRLFPGIDPTKEPTYQLQPKSAGVPPGAVAMPPQHMPQRIGSISVAGPSNSAAASPASSVHHGTPQMAAMPGLPSAQPAQPT